MHIEFEQDRKFKVILWSISFLAIGFLSSPTIVSLYHILILVPTILLIKSGERISIPKSGWFLIALALWGVISNTVNIDELQKVRKSYDELKFYISGVLLIVPLGYFFHRVKLSQIKRVVSLVSFVVIIAFIVGVVKAYFKFDLLTFETGDWQARSDGLTNYMRYGYASAFLFIIGLSIHLNWDKTKKFVNPKIFYIAFILCLLAVFAAKTRGALLAILVGVPFLLLKYKPKIASCVIFVGFLFVCIVSFYSLTGKVPPSRFLSVNDGSNKIRLSQFESALKSIKEKPVFGVGASQFAYHVPRIKKEYDLKYKWYSGHSHNIFLEHAANYGIPGLILFLGFIVFWFLELLKQKSLISWTALSYLVAFLVSGQVENLFDNTNSHLLFFIYSFSHAFKPSYMGEEYV